jgi:hypothetical protein
LLPQRGSFYDSASFDAGMGIGYLFDSAPGRAYLRSFGVEDPLISQQIDAKIEAWDGTTCVEYFGEWRTATSSELDRE